MFNALILARNMEILINALKNDFGVIAEKSGRNDMTVDGKKVSNQDTRLLFLLMRRSFLLSY